MELSLRVEPLGGESFAFECKTPSVVIGRSAGVDLTITGDQFLSRRHARIFQNGDEWFIEDIGSRNTTILNGKPVKEPTRLGTGDTILVDSSTLSANLPPATPKPD